MAHQHGISALSAAGEGDVLSAATHLRKWRRAANRLWVQALSIAVTLDRGCGS